MRFLSFLTPHSSLLTPLLALLLAAQAPGCIRQYDDFSANSEINLDVSVLTNACPGGAVEMEAPTILRAWLVDQSTVPAQVIATVDVTSIDSVIVFKGFDQTEDLEVIVHGFSPGDDLKGPPSFIGQSTEIRLARDEIVQVPVLLSRFGGSSCIEVIEGVKNAMFPTITPLPDGRLFVAGGFTEAVEEDDIWILQAPTARGYLFDPSTGEVQSVGNLMNAGRGAHAAIYIPETGRVLLVGGHERLNKAKAADGLMPWYFEEGYAGTPGFTYELFDVAKQRFLEIDDLPSKSNEMVQPVDRVFPCLTRNNDGTVLVTGGAPWPSSHDTGYQDVLGYRVSEIYVPEGIGGTSGFQVTLGALTMSSVRFGHTGSLVKVEDGHATHLFLGGAGDGAVAEIYRESSGQIGGNYGMFSPIVVGGEDPGGVFFHRVVPMTDGDFLLVGGVKIASSGPSDSYALSMWAGDEAWSEQIDDGPSGRYFHAAVVLDRGWIFVFDSFEMSFVDSDWVFHEIATGEPCFMGPWTESWVKPWDHQETRSSRAGSAIAALGKRVVIAGGVRQMNTDLGDWESDVPLHLEILHPAISCSDGSDLGSCW